MWKEAIQKRCSRRTYKKAGLSEDMICFLTERIAEYNQIANIAMQLVTCDAAAFKGFKHSYGMFKNVENYIMLICDKQDVYGREKLGYYGERLVLEATAKGLGTCWVGGTFHRASCPCKLKGNQELCCVIAIGYVDENLHIKEKVIAKTAHRKSKTLEQMSNIKETSPKWFRKGMEAVQLAPSALYKQPVIFKLQEEKVTATVEYEYLDLGIAMLHFELGSEEGSWTWGNPANYKRKR